MRAKADSPSAAGCRAMAACMSACRQAAPTPTATAGCRIAPVPGAGAASVRRAAAQGAGTPTGGVSVRRAPTLQRDRQQRIDLPAVEDDRLLGEAGRFAIE